MVPLAPPNAAELMRLLTTAEGDRPESVAEEDEVVKEEGGDGDDGGGG